jgi:hypothetical protein
MAYKIQAAFSAGELDPALHERTTLEKYQQGLKTLRNAYANKTGRIVSRPGTKLLRQGHVALTDAILIGIPNTAILLEWGHQVCKFHDLDLNITSTIAHAFTEADLPYLQFVLDGSELYIFKEGSDYLVLDIYLGFKSAANKLYQHPAPTIALGATVSTTIYRVQYMATYIEDGEECFPGSYGVMALAARGAK